MKTFQRWIIQLKKFNDTLKKLLVAFLYVPDSVLGALSKIDKNPIPGTMTECVCVPCGVLGAGEEGQEKDRNTMDIFL